MNDRTLPLLAAMLLCGCAPRTAAPPAPEEISGPPSERAAAAPPAVPISAIPVPRQDGPLRLEGFLLERTVRLKVTSLSGPESEIHREERVLVADGRVAVQDLTFGRRWIVRPDRSLVWVADPLGGTYSELPFDAVERRRKEIMDELEEIRDRVKGTPDEAEIGTLLLRMGRLPAGAEILRQDDAQKKVEILVDKRYRPLEAAVPDPELAGAMPYFDAMMRIGAFPAPVAEALRGLPGYPRTSRQRYALFGDLVMADEKVTRAVREAIPAAEFELPPGLTKVPLRGFEREPAPPAELPPQFGGPEEGDGGRDRR